jgi:Bacterial Ig-like domain (group 3)
VDTSTLGEHTFTVHAADHGGNKETASATYTVVDRTAPTITLTTPASGAVYGLGEQVAADYSCADEAGGSGLASCSGTVAGGDAVDTSSVGEKTFKVEAADNAGNPASKSVSYTVVDRTAPTIAVAAPVDGGAYTVGQQVLADYSCADQPGGSGVASCDGTVPNGEPIDTSEIGTHTFEVHAADGAGNPASATVTYSVHYDFDGFFLPVRNLPTVNRWKAGVPVPIRFSLNGYSGQRPEAAGYPRSNRCGGGDVELVARGAARTRAAFEYARRSGRYTMIWKTDRDWAGTCREFVLRLDDGSVHMARFRFVKHPRRD